jgi:Tfp pilus assembly protein PilF
MTSIHRSPNEILSDLDAIEQRVKRRALWLTVVPLLLVLGAHGFLLLRIQDSASELKSTQAELAMGKADVEKTSATLDSLNAELESKRKELTEAQVAVDQFRERNSELQRAVSWQEDEQKRIAETLEAPKKTDAKLAEVKALMMNSKTAPRAKAISLWNQGYAAFNAGDTQTAKKLYQQAKDTDPEYAPAVNSLGRLLYESGDIKAAQPLFEQAARIDPKYVPTIHNQALVAEKQGKHEQAIELNKRSLQLKPNYAPALSFKESLKANAP